MWSRRVSVAVTLVLGACQDTSAPIPSPPDLGGAMADQAKAMSAAMIATMQPKVTGAIHSAGADMGTWDITPTECQSGERSGFFGADFYVTGSDELRLRYVHDEAAGDVVKVGLPSKPGTVRVFDRASTCKVLEGAIERTNVTTWTPKGRMRHVTGHVKFDCLHSDGAGHVSGELTFEHCH